MNGMGLYIYIYYAYCNIMLKTGIEEEREISVARQPLGKHA
jgi:hypothetical protein